MTKGVIELGNYEGFRNTISKLLRRYKYGLTWNEIREKAKLTQAVPYNGWVKKMEKEIGLKRVRDARGILWMVKQ